MNKFTQCFLFLGAIIALCEGVSPEAEPLGPYCSQVEPCARPQLFGLPPDGPESGTEAATPPPAQMVVESGLTRFVFDISSSHLEWLSAGPST
jgi:hypothetical protein